MGTTPQSISTLNFAHFGCRSVQGIHQMITSAEELPIARLTLGFAGRSKDSSVLTVTFGKVMLFLSILQEFPIYLICASFFEFSGWQHEVLL